MRELFLQCAEVVLAAVADPQVGAAWDSPSVLAEQTIGGLASHLARGGIWVVRDYLDASVPTGAVDFPSPAHYGANFGSAATPEDRAAVRARGAAVARAGHAAVVDQARAGLAALRERLPQEPADRLVAVIAATVMRLDDYLVTRIIEQVVHLDDLARSLDVDPWPTPEGAEALVIACGTEVGRLRNGAPAMVRAIYRGHTAGVFPVL